MFGKGVDQVATPRTWSDAGGMGGWIDFDEVERTEIEQKPFVTQRRGDVAMAASAQGYPHLLAFCKLDCLGHFGGIGAANDGIGAAAAFQPLVPDDLCPRMIVRIGAAVKGLSEGGRGRGSHASPSSEYLVEQFQHGGPTLPIRARIIGSGRVGCWPGIREAVFHAAV